MNNITDSDRELYNLYKRMSSQELLSLSDIKLHGDIISNYNKLINDECIGWMECGIKKTYKGIEIYEIPRNTILYKGVNRDKRLQSQKYYSDPYYIPGQIAKMGINSEDFPNAEILTSDEDKFLDVLFLAGKVDTAVLYCEGMDSRVILFKTINIIRLANLSNIETLKYIYNNSDIESKRKLEHAFMIDTKTEFKSRGRLSHKSIDYLMVADIKRLFTWLDGYALEPGINFHEEIAIFRPFIVLERYSIEYRPTGIQITNSKKVFEIWLKVIDGYNVEPILIQINRVLYRHKYNRIIDDGRDNFIENPFISKKNLLLFLEQTIEYQNMINNKKFKLIDTYIY